VKLPPEADYLNDETLEVYENDKKKYDQTNQLITNNSVTILLGDFCYYESAWSSRWRDNRFWIGSKVS
jgi:hypothetical protein